FIVVRLVCVSYLFGIIGRVNIFAALFSSDGRHVSTLSRRTGRRPVFTDRGGRRVHVIQHLTDSCLLTIRRHRTDRYPCTIRHLRCRYVRLILRNRRRLQTRRNSSTNVKKIEFFYEGGYH
ncbi:hypothetical protein BGY98DRAFT_1185198, partial [Russula aff. rugulosa BPL654]